MLAFKELVEALKTAAKVGRGGAHRQGRLARASSETPSQKKINH